MQNMSSSLEYLDKFVIEPIDDIPIFSKFKEVHIEQLALILETFENHLCVIMKYVFWMLEVTFSGSRALAERCRRGSELSSLLFSSEIIASQSCMCEVFLRWKVVTSIVSKISSMHAKPLTGLFKIEKSLIASIFSLVSPPGLTCVILQVHMHAMAFAVATICITQSCSIL
jgi:hypothetical protein